MPAAGAFAAASAVEPRMTFGFAAAPASGSGKIAMYSPEFYAACTAGGVLSCGLTHLAVTPMDIAKCNMQVRAWSRSLGNIMSFRPPLGE